MAPAPALADLEASIADHRARFFEARNQLAAAITPVHGHATAHDIADGLLTACIEYDAAEVVRQVGEDRRAFRIRGDSDVEQLSPLLEAAFQLDAELTHLITQREDLLGHVGEQRAMNDFGREFTFSLVDRTLRYRDAPDRSEPLMVTRVDPSPDVARDRSPRRRRDRDR